MKVKDHPTDRLDLRFLEEGVMEISDVTQNLDGMRSLGDPFDGLPSPVLPRGGDSSKVVDARAEKFLNEDRSKWHDWNVPYEDGKMLYDLIIKNHYRAALEIGTSTGHSAIWTAWALSKTGGTLTTIEIDDGRFREALINFKRAGVEHHNPKTPRALTGKAL